jgi:uncharacterized protein YrzB (UPF0473 family)
MNDLEELKGKTFTAINADGDEIECEVVMTYFCYKNNYTYIFYTDNIRDEEGILNLYASRYLGENNGELELEDIVEDEEWKLLDKAYEEAKEGLNE